MKLIRVSGGKVSSGKSLMQGGGVARHLSGAGRRIIWESQYPVGATGLALGAQAQHVGRGGAKRGSRVGGN